ncbi:MFS transporter [Fructilactobacillus fructivorans]|uniref:Multidrug transport protein n=1 Tax=Fructilactobacillus fructivorans TaxID=1614 RepID=A0A0C1PNQ0_9LACO|nr:MFS transporter [Fructilactobacillus fructivorans]KID42367.1 multidrug transport protein [Fructilactobacillus fructivorans]MCT0151016.1 MFS transporter [Fructilactobacillus fructivorans]MCT2867426.1 MFS transporter [Fructilactobacillus fructivorans]MCT2869055.1 MFS transporter [Fructilactobacillus fructivorans]MCT2873225.1 MFS transporter [Fructilactobacillus fructivorans]
MSKAAKRAIFILIIANFIICLGMSLVIPVEPFIKNEYHLTTAQMGTMTSLYALAQFIGSPIVGRVSDKIGRAPILAGGLILYSVSEVMFAASNTLLLFDVSRLIGGISAAMVVPTSMAMAADLSSSEQRAKVIGLLSAAFSGGLIIGPGIGGALAKFGYKTPFWFAGALGIIAVIFFVVGLPKHIKQTGSSNAVMEEVHITEKGLKSILNGAMVALFAMILISSFGLQGFESIYTIYVNQVFHFTLDNIAIVLIINGMISLVLQVVFFDWLVRMRGELGLIRDCFILSSICIVWILFAHTKIEVIIATLVVFCAFDVLRPAITTLLTRFGKNNQGLINGLNMSLTSVGNIIGPIFSGILMDINPHYPYSIVAIILLFSAFITFVVRYEMRHTKGVKSDE